MRKITTILLMTVFLSCVSFISAGADTPTGESTLRVGVRANVSGFGYLNTDTGRYTGLEVDISEELAGRLGYSDVEFVTVTPDSCESLLSENEIDCALACFSITDERLETMDFSPAYYTDTSVVLLEDSSLFTNIFEMTDCTFGMMKGSDTVSQLIGKLVQLGFTDGELLMTRSGGTEFVYDNFTIEVMDTYDELDEALEAGSIDAMCSDGCIIKSFLYADRNIMKNFQIGSEEYGAVTLKDSDLSEPLANVIQEMLDDGSIEALIDKWD